MRSRLTTLVCLLVLSTQAAAQQAVRMNWETFIQDPARVQSLRNGIQVMRSRDNADPTSALYRTSWKYWASMHGYFGPGSVFGNVAQAIQAYNQGNGDPLLLPLYNGITDMTPPDSVAQQVWGQCQHGTDWFFPWHRLYLYYFEQVLQKAANDPNLRLPYWDYTNTANLAMPTPYSSDTYVDAQGHIDLNPLYEPRRTPGWNPPGGNTLDPTATDIDDALKLPTFFDVNGVQDSGFQNSIEDNVHGYVHCTVVPCPGPDMGAVGYSANDPIFWSHHANIDRMWDCWMALGNTNPGGSWLTQTFSFVDADGNLVTNQVADLFNGKIKFGYVYQQASNCSRTAPQPEAKGVPAPPSPAVESARAKLAKPAVLANVKQHVINAAVTRKRLPIASGALAGVRSVALKENAALPVRVDLVLRNIQFSAHPGTQFHVYLERRDDPKKRARVGTLSFFTSPGHEHGSLDRSFDVTDELRELAASSADLKEINVVFEATTGRRGETEAPFSADTRLTIGEIELRVTATEP